MGGEGEGEDNAKITIVSEQQMKYAINAIEMALKTDILSQRIS